MHNVDLGMGQDHRDRNSAIPRHNHRWSGGHLGPNEVVEPHRHCAQLGYDSGAVRPDASAAMSQEPGPPCDLFFRVGSPITSRPAWPLP